jgi:hypothetical protein
MAEDASSEYECEGCAFDSNLAGGREGVVAEGFAVFLYDLAGDEVACVGFVQEDGCEEAKVDGGVFGAAGEKVEDFFDGVQMEEVEDARSEGCWWFDAEFCAVYSIEGVLSEAYASLDLILPVAGVPRATIGAAGTRSCACSTDD